VHSTLYGWTLQGLSHPASQALAQSSWSEGQVWESGTISVSEPDELIVSASSITGGVAVALQFGDGSGWSDWIDGWRWRSPRSHLPDRSAGWVECKIDTILLRRPVTLLRARVEQTSLQSLILSGSKSANPHSVKDHDGPIDPVLVDVPFRSQMDANPDISLRICGPTCLAMVLEACGTNVGTEEMAKECYDAEEDIYGNWSRMVAVAGENGVWGWASRFNGLGAIASHARSGGLAVLSIAFEGGALSGAALERTDGHLVVLKGVDADGDVICNDPSFGDNRGDSVVYQRDEFLKAWLGHGGVGILFAKQ